MALTVTKNPRTRAYIIELGIGVDRIRCLITLRREQALPADRETEVAALKKARSLAKEMLSAIEKEIGQ